ncbi:UdgX family uracil-DNA binding protein [Mariniblastus fucicola]|uniref:Type-4 uracil-DNA glycosylase n=1 Tax=Mariniblastus fucicola TaxID=980251 RepID=A0A5B9PH73_9BACT|nr:UdgX family uracil-DNA binding protein [Mariniblastus fucicola]QEG24959.1 Uracil DNA glycosylase superfamily protein [Mariniblastus fucicola]
MRTIRIKSYEQWRHIARGLIAGNASPAELQLVEDDGQQSLFCETSRVDSLPGKIDFRVPRAFLLLAESVGYHRDARRWNVLYRVLWRIRHEQPQLLDIETDDDVIQLTRMEKQVRRDAHKMKAFVRFRKVIQDGVEHFIAWHQPDHRIVRKVAPFFSRRFAGMNWTILTPDESMTWDQSNLTYGGGVTRSDAPGSDQLEDLWKTYYANIFNPARVKIKMMKSEMPVRYWKNLPEAQIIDELLADAPRRVEKMIEQYEGFDQTAIDFLPTLDSLSLPVLQKAAANCKACDLHCAATQTVFGSGPADARIVLLGEQPGDREDLAGQPFIGPAGQVLNEAIEKAGLVRGELYLTNVVKHFKFKVSSAGQGGKRRLHQKPNSREIRACRPWFDAEWSCLKNADILVCLGATAMNAIMGPGRKLGDTRGRWIETDHSQRTIATWHPSAILRSYDADSKSQKFQQLVDDLKFARDSILNTKESGEYDV